MKGVTLIEVLVSMFIFIIMILAMTGAFVTIIHKRIEVKKMQQQTEEFSLAMSYMAKKIRTSDYIDCTTTSCTVRDHHTGNPVTFTFDMNALTLTEGSAILASHVTGRFVARHTAPALGEVPTITMSMMAPNMIYTAVQTTVSLRSY